jgi:hypothetical protein
VLDIPVVPKKSSRRMIQLPFCVPLTAHKMRLHFVFLRNLATFVRHLPGQNPVRRCVDVGRVRCVCCRPYREVCELCAYCCVGSLACVNKSTA